MIHRSWLRRIVVISPALAVWDSVFARRRQ